MAYITVDEEQLIEKITPKIEEKVRYDVVQSIIGVLEEQFYPPEEMIREEVIKEIEEVEKEVAEGKSKVYSYEEFKKQLTDLPE
ncbi:hypothetical protein BEH94_08935 [Candidatus Altiarchaeales archaeon WOR_SM1_SCG]|nr:hypothetical protein BEH94_08935 [Candidatus Altiarchaeales archaeon WOR_SM1_SCG]